MSQNPLTFCAPSFDKKPATAMNEAAIAVITMPARILRAVLKSTPRRINRTKYHITSGVIATTKNAFHDW
jgi:hypothetical protein